MSFPLPGRPAHDLELPTVDGGRWSLKAEAPKNFTLLVFYRGLHCPLCKKNLQQLQQRLDQFEKAGIRVFAASCDDEQRARQAVTEWDIGRLTVGYDLRIDEARSWGLYLSSPINKEPAPFCEPGMFLIDSQQKVFACFKQSVPFARPDYDDLLTAIRFINENDYPARGDLE